jgi:hypothetical protein
MVSASYRDEKPAHSLLLRNFWGLITDFTIAPYTNGVQFSPFSETASVISTIIFPSHLRLSLPGSFARKKYKNEYSHGSHVYFYPWTNMNDSQ